MLKITKQELEIEIKKDAEKFLDNLKINLKELPEKKQIKILTQAELNLNNILNLALQNENYIMYIRKYL